LPPANSDPFARPATTSAADPNELKPTAPDTNELKPSAAADPNELKPSADAQGAAVPPPVQVNEIQQGQPPADTATSDSSSNLATDKDISSSKKKKKSGLKKIIAF
jgi:hypothetical protein